MSGDEFYGDDVTSGPATDDRPGADFTPCHRAGHVFGCPGGAGGDHELEEGWIAIEQPDGTVVEVEVAA